MLIGVVFLYILSFSFHLHIIFYHLKLFGTSLFSPGEFLENRWPLIKRKFPGVLPKFGMEFASITRAALKKNTPLLASLLHPLEKNGRGALIYHERENNPPVGEGVHTGGGFFFVLFFASFVFNTTSIVWGGRLNMWW